MPVLIVAECNVNYRMWVNKGLLTLVLIVAECNVNTKSYR